MIAPLQKDVYKHLREDAGLMPGGAAGDWLDPDDHAALQTILGCNSDDQFALHVVFAPQSYKIEDYLPLIWFTVQKRRAEMRDVELATLVVRIFDNDSSGAVLGRIERRILALLDGAVSGTYLWNACPLQATYTGPWQQSDGSAIEATSLTGVYKQVLEFQTLVPRLRDMRGRMA